MRFTRRPGFAKYGNKRTVVDGITFHSKREANRWQELRLLQRAGKIALLRRQVRFKLAVNGVVIGCYVADFTYIEHGRLVVEDSKGMRLDLYKWKAQHFAAQYGFAIREV